MSIKYSIVIVLLTALSYTYFSNHFNSENSNEKFRSFVSTEKENDLYPYE